MFPQIGFSELIVMFISLLLTLAFPVAILYGLYAIYKKLKSIDEGLKKTKDEK
jgi:hypothetical protein